MEPSIKVGMAEMAVLKDSGELCSLGLGSCVAVCLYDLPTKIAGMAHVMLPDSERSMDPGNKGKFADLAVPLLISQMTALGADALRLVAIIVGGAEMFSFPGRSYSALRIGERNIEAVKKLLEECGIPIIGESVAGKQGKSVSFDVSTGIIQVRTLMGGFAEFSFADSGERVIGSVRCE